jgi:hypothetical protein
MDFKKADFGGVHLTRHPGLEPGFIPQSHERFNDGPRLKAGATCR